MRPRPECSGRGFLNIDYQQERHPGPLAPDLLQQFRPPHVKTLGMVDTDFP